MQLLSLLSYVGILAMTTLVMQGAVVNGLDTPACQNSCQSYYNVCVVGCNNGTSSVVCPADVEGYCSSKTCSASDGLCAGCWDGCTSDMKTPALEGLATADLANAKMEKRQITNVDQVICQDLQYACEHKGVGAAQLDPKWGALACLKWFCTWNGNWCINNDWDDCWCAAQMLDCFPYCYCGID